MQVAKQWYDYERGAYHFVHVARELQSPLLCKRVSDFDMNGIFYWIGSNARSVSLSFSFFHFHLLLQPLVTSLVASLLVTYILYMYSTYTSLPPVSFNFLPTHLSCPFFPAPFFFTYYSFFHHHLLYIEKHTAREIVCCCMLHSPVYIHTLLYPLHLYICRCVT